jgi:hypothetical protein
LSNLRDKLYWRAHYLDWAGGYIIQMANTFHIRKWIFVAISNCSKIDEIISELTALMIYCGTDPQGSYFFFVVSNLLLIDLDDPRDATNGFQLLTKVNNIDRLN